MNKEIEKIIVPLKEKLSEVVLDLTKEDYDYLVQDIFKRFVELNVAVSTTVAANHRKGIKERVGLDEVVILHHTWANLHYLNDINNTNTYDIVNTALETTSFIDNWLD